MDTKRTSRKLSYISWISIAVCFLYGVYPFLNGVGCNYHSQADDSVRSYYSTCKLGVINTVVKNKITAESIAYKGVYGKTGKTAFFIVYKVNNISNGDDNVKHIVSFFHKSRIYISKVIPRNGVDWIILESPYHTIHSVKRIGKLSYW